MAKNFLWWRDGIIYQIYPRSFYDASGDGIGDLRGIIEKLDYLQDLGIDAIWLSPVYPSPDRDFGYDVSDYCSIDPKFGSMSDFERLIKAAETKGIRVIMDLVLNHSSDQHSWFLESRRSLVSPKRDWYIWKDGKSGKHPPNNWLSVFGGSAWEWDEKIRQYYLHLFYKEQPDFNWRNPEVRRNMLDVFRFWLDKGVKGFRLDVFNLYFKDSQFRDNPIRPFRIRPDQRQEFLYICDLPEMMDILSKIRKILDQYEDSYVVGETFITSPEKAAGYCGDGLLHQAFLFDFLNCRWNADCFARVIKKWESALGPDKWPNYVLNNHDVKRSASRYGRGEVDDRLKVAAAMLLTLRGTPFLYYGEEIGMREVNLKHSQILDPVGLRFWPFYKGRDGCRTPIQWRPADNAGFSKTAPWLPLHPDWRDRNVESQAADPDSLFNFYKKLIALRRRSRSLVNGEMNWVDGLPANVLGYQRKFQKETAIILLNFANTGRCLTLKSAEGKAGNFLSNKRNEIPNVKNGLIELMADEVLIIML